MRRALLVGALSSTLLLGACSFKPMSVVVQPELTVKQAQPKGQASIRLSVVDGRDVAALGSRSISGKSASIDAQNDIPQALKTAFAAAYAQQGFVVGDDASLPLVTLTLAETDYVSQSKALAGTTTTLNTVLKLKVENGAKTYEKTYRTSMENKTTFTPMREDMEKMVNEALSDALQRAVADKAVQDVILAK